MIDSLRVAAFVSHHQCPFLKPAAIAVQIFYLPENSSLKIHNKISIAVIFDDQHLFATEEQEIAYLRLPNSAVTENIRSDTHIFKAHLNFEWVTEPGV